jgi:hypothetical protein
MKPKSDARSDVRINYSMRQRLIKEQREQRSLGEEFWQGTAFVAGNRKLCALRRL